MSNVDRIRLRLSFTPPNRPDADLADALREVLLLNPPRINEGDDPDLHETLTEGWTTCMDTVLSTIARKLGVDQ